MIRFAAVVVGCLSLLPLGAFAQESAASPLVVGREAPSIAAFDANDNPISLATLARTKGTRGVVTQLWASWCKPCVHELKELSKNRKELEEKGIRVFLVNLAFSDDAEAVNKLVKELDLASFPLAFDRTGAVATAAGLEPDENGVLKLPLTVVVDSSLSIRLVLRDAPKDYVKKLFAALEKAPARP